MKYVVLNLVRRKYRTITTMVMFYAYALFLNDAAKGGNYWNLVGAAFVAASIVIDVVEDINQARCIKKLGHMPTIAKVN